MLRREQTAGFTRAVADRHQVTAGLETEQAAGGRRQADRAAPVAGMGHRQDASRNRSGRPAGGAAGTVLEVPGVARIPEQAALGGRAVAELRAAGLAENYQASLAGLAYIAVIGRCPGLAEEPRAVGGDGIGHADAQVLEQEGYAAKGALGQGRAGQLPGTVVMLEYYGIDAGIDLLGAGDCQFQQFGGADLALADQPRQFQRVTAPVFIETHAAVRPSRQRTQPQRGARRQADGALEKMPSCYPGHCSSLFLLSGQASGLKGDKLLLQGRQ